MYQSKIIAGEAVAPIADSPLAADTRTARQFTIFAVEGETFAVSLDEVKEIIRMPEVVRVPLAPPSLEGLTNLRGTVLPIVNTRRLFGSAPAAADDATRVVILDHGQPVGIVVDRVVSVVTIETGRIEDAASVETSVRSDLLRGVIKDEGELGLVMILDSGRLIEQEFEMLALARGETVERAHAAGPAETQPPAADAERDEIQLVSFEVADQEYALPIHSVREIVQLPETVTRVPRAAPSVMGVISLRDRLLPVVCLRRLFGLPPAERSDHNRVAVVSVGDGGLLVGVVLDRVNEVLRVRRGGIDAMPPMLADDADLSEFSAICRLDGGKRLVSILSAEAMFDRRSIEGALESAMEATGGEAMVMTAASHVRSTGSAGDEEQFVVFRLMDEEFGVDIAVVQEIVRVPSDLAKVPRTEDFIRGVMNLRGAVIPLIDQRARFNLPPLDDNDRQRIVVFTMGGVQTGFIVDSVSEVMRIRREHIKPAPDMSDRQRRMIRRVVNLPESRRMILLLDAEQMLTTAAPAAEAA
ncbi:chemotaxis protein CheW [Novosphingobium huizhouense]|uniref:chemotaxis protein CheW n=1 Tax=Novosphingobium huizhouense TaxID=2866625 RepID=UPI001CD842BF|nr:chemotaxis protein CheW [Novosphingobium huizhouense]